MSITFAAIQANALARHRNIPQVDVKEMSDDRPRGTFESPFVIADEPPIATIPVLSARPQPRPSSSRRQSTPQASRSNRGTAPASQSKRKPEEKRILPVRMRGLGGSSGTGSNVTGKDVEDMIYQCFSRTLTSSKLPTEDLPICLTVSPYEAVSSTLNNRAQPEPTWWTSPLPDPASLLVSPSATRKSVALPSPSPVKKRRPSGLDMGEVAPMINGRKRVVMPGFRKVIEEDDVMPNEKRKTRGAATTTELEDSSDAHYQTLHLRYERYESRARLAERQKMEHGRYKLSIRIEYLEGLSDDVWEGAVMRMMQRGKRVRSVEEPKGEGQGHDRNQNQQESDANERPEAKSLEVIQAEAEERAYMATMEAGAALLNILTIPGLKRELIREGKELLARYDRVLAKPKQEKIPVPVPLPSMHRRVEKRARSRASSRESTMTPPPPETEEELAIRRAMISSLRKRSNSPELLGSEKPPSKRHLPIPSKVESLDMSKTVATPSTRSTRPSRSTRAIPTTPLPTQSGPAFIPYIEPYYPPMTESGKPAIVEAADKRYIALQNAEKAKELLAKQKVAAGGKVASTTESTRSGRRSRTDTMLPLGVAPPRMLGWKMDFDLDGDFWRPLLTERGYGDAIDPPDMLPDGLASYAPLPESLDHSKPDPVPAWIDQMATARVDDQDTKLGSMEMPMDVDQMMGSVIDVDVDVDETVEAAVEDVI